MYDGLLEAYGQVVWLSNKKKFALQYLPTSGVKTAQNAPFSCKNDTKVDSAPENGSNMMCDDSLEAHGQKVWLFNNFLPPSQFFVLSGGKRPPKCPL